MGEALRYHVIPIEIWYVLGLGVVSGAVYAQPGGHTSSAVGAQNDYVA